MKTRKRHSIKKSNSENTPSNENIWYFNESTTDHNTFQGNQKSFRNDRRSIRIPKQAEGSLPDKHQPSFIVDWEITE